MKKFYTLILGAMMATPMLAQNNVNTYPADVANDYVDLLLDMVPTTPGFTPPVASRSFGYIGLSLYESLQPGIPTKGSLSGFANELSNLPVADANTNYHWPTVANNALATIIDSLYYNTPQTNKDLLHGLRDTYNAAFATEENYEESVAYGVAVANAVFEYSSVDGGHHCQVANFPASYIPPVGEGLWEPLVVNGTEQKALQPYWGNNRAFAAVNEDDAIMPVEFLPEFSTDEASAWHLAQDEVYSVGLNLTEEQAIIANWWADGSGTITPPGHSMSMARQLLIEENANLEKAAIAYGMLGLSLSDAFLVCWKTKFIYNTERPITYIQEQIDETWTPLIGTPPFPEFPSGHSSQSGAMGTVLTYLFGENVSFTDETWTNTWGPARTYNSIWEAAEEAAVSRLYGGIHPTYGNEGGLSLGTDIGNNIIDLFEEASVVVSTEELASNTITVYPNPAKDVLFIADQKPAQMIRLFNTQGQLAMQESNTNRLNIAELQTGVYIVEVTTADNSVMHKQIIKN